MPFSLATAGDIFTGLNRKSRLESLYNLLAVCEVPGEVGGSLLNQFSPALEGSTELLEVNRYSPPFVIGAAPSVDRICFFRDPMLPRNVFSGPWQIQVFHLPPPIRQIPGAEGCSKRTGERGSPDCLVCKGEQQGQSRPEGARGGYHPPRYHRHTEEAKPRGQVCGHFIGLREHDRRFIPQAGV